jgi:hypothetical protein
MNSEVGESNGLTEQPEASKRSPLPPHPFGPRQSRWRVWLARIVMISLLFVVLLTFFNLMGVIVEKFFVTIYTD